MSLKNLLSLLVLFYFGCAAYKQLKPDPAISFIENGYLEIADDEDKFELDKGKKYFMKFPQPQYENTYLVLTFDVKPLLNSYLTRAFNDGKGMIIKMEDESLQPQKMSVYPIDKMVPTYYWVIENVTQDLNLNLQYRYIAIWRFKFEQKKEEYESVLNQNSHNRSIYNAIGVSLPAREIDYGGEQSAIQTQIPKLTELHSHLDEIEKIFPAQILNSQDESYLAYLALQKNLEGEILFQKKYQQALTALSSLSDPQQSMSSFVDRTPEYNSLLGDSSAYQANIMAESRQLIRSRLQNLPGFLQSDLRQKQNSEAIATDMQAIEKLYLLSNQPTPETIFKIGNFVSAFNQRQQALTNVQKELKDLQIKIQNSGNWPNNIFYIDRQADLSAIRSRIPPTNLDPFGDYQSLGCINLLHKDVNNFRAAVARSESDYRRAEGLVAQINQYKDQGYYRDIIRLLRTSDDLSFLIAQYPDIDDLSLAQQKALIDESLNQQLWENAENSLESMYHDNLFINPGKTEPVKNRLVRDYEEQIGETVETLSLNNANTLVDQNQATYMTVDSLYSNPALYPVYKLNFTSGSRAELESKNRDIEAKMNYIRTQKFPETAIPVLYREFSQDPQDNGVFKARAIVIHGRNYQGQDTKIKNLVAECDPAAAKWITKPTAYRKIYVLPTTSNRSGSNEYLLRINLQIPSEAQFPVFDVNVKLPEEIARRAGSQQWYKEITFNKNVLKNEGRFSITAPTAENNYETQITPLQVNKTGSNVLEIRFNFAAFKVFEVSIMAQKPIIKKN